MRPLLLLTRPEPQSQRFAQAALAGCPPHELLVAPLSRIAKIQFDPRAFADADALILTSANALPMLRDLPLKGLTAWCVGAATAEAAQQYGFTAITGGGTAKALITRLEQAEPQGKLIHAHGLHLAKDIAATLRPSGLNVFGIAVYEAEKVDWPDTVTQTLEQAQRVIAPLFSPRAARQFVQQLGTARPEGLHLVAISEACAAALPGDLRRHTTIANAPDAGEMLRAIAEAMSQPVEDVLRRAQAMDK